MIEACESEECVCNNREDRLSHSCQINFLSKAILPSELRARTWHLESNPAFVEHTISMATNPCSVISQYVKSLNHTATRSCVPAVLLLVHVSSHGYDTMIALPRRSTQYGNMPYSNMPRRACFHFARAEVIICLLYTSPSPRD